jgi:hypothetical protein
MKENIINSLKKLFSGATGAIKVTYHTSRSYDIIKFDMLGYQITEENGIITVYDDKDSQVYAPKTITIDPLTVDSVVYKDDKSDSQRISSRNVVIHMTDKSRIELGTMAIG